MKNVTIYEVLTGDEAERRVRFTSLDQYQAETHARGIHKEEGCIPDIMAGEWAPTDHTTVKARLAKAQAKADHGMSIETRLAAGAAKIRAARELAETAK